MFICECRKGRATAAPDIRKNKTPAVDGSSRLAEIHPNNGEAQRQADNNGSKMTAAATAHDDINERSAMHDSDVLPHMYE